jgi:hypothetical protein
VLSAAWYREAVARNAVEFIQHEVCGKWLLVVAAADQPGIALPASHRLFLEGKQDRTEQAGHAPMETCNGGHTRNDNQARRVV